jgi:hypothetical protein
METITIRVDERVAQLFKAATEQEKRKMEALISLRLLETIQTKETLENVMRRISRNAQVRGLTPEILEDILNNDE